MICFVGHSNRSSGIIRGRQVAERMPGASFVDASSNAIHQVRDKTCLIVRQPDTHIAKILKANGCRVGYDLLDRPVSDYHDAFARGSKDGDFDWGRYAHEAIDFYVVNNSLAKDRLAKAVGSKPIHIIPHHTVNFESRKNNFPDKVMKVAYVGIPNQFSHQSVIGEICQKHGAKLISVNPQTRDECVSVMSTVDVGVVFVEQVEKVPYTLSYKPNTKLNNFQSFGIPTVAVPYASFDEFGGTAWARVTSLDDFTSNLERLIEDVGWRRDMSDVGWEHAKGFQIDNVVRKYYQPLLEH